MSPPLRVAVIGAGLAGLTCARQLQQNATKAISVTVFEKSRVLGGRCATKTNFHDSLIDHGAPYFTLSNPQVNALLCPLLRDVHAVPPNAIVDPLGKPLPTPHPLYYCKSGNSALGAALAHGLDVQNNALVLSVQKDGSVVSEKHDDSGAPRKETQHSQFDMVVVSAPLPQAAILLDAPRDVTEDWQAAYAPNLTGLLAYDAALIPPSSRAHACHTGGAPLAVVAPDVWVGCEAWKRGAARGALVLVAQGSDSFSDEFVGCADEVWIARLRVRAEEVWDVPARARIGWFAKRWRYARVRQGRRSVEARAAWMGDKVVVCGDGVGGVSGVEEAVLQGLAGARVAWEVLGS